MWCTQSHKGSSLVMVSWFQTTSLFCLSLFCKPHLSHFLLPNFLVSSTFFSFLLLCFTPWHQKSKIANLFFSILLLSSRFFYFDSLILLLLELRELKRVEDSKSIWTFGFVNYDWKGIMELGISDLCLAFAIEKLKVDFGKIEKKMKRLHFAVFKLQTQISLGGVNGLTPSGPDYWIWTELGGRFLRVDRWLFVDRLFSVISANSGWPTAAQHLGDRPDHFFEHCARYFWEDK